jgi:hypothetical protein
MVSSGVSMVRTIAKSGVAVRPAVKARPTDPEPPAGRSPAFPEAPVIPMTSRTKHLIGCSYVFPG